MIAEGTSKKTMERDRKKCGGLDGINSYHSASQSLIFYFLIFLRRDSMKGHLDCHCCIFHQGVKASSEPCPYCQKVCSTKSSVEPHIDGAQESEVRLITICNPAP
jgi:hypothetical protein